MSLRSLKTKRPRKSRTLPSPPPPLMASSSSSSSSSSSFSVLSPHIRSRCRGMTTLYCPLFVLVLVLVLYVTWKEVFYISSSARASISTPPKFFTFEIVNEYPHDPAAFTQGLLYAGNNTLFESTGLYGQSSVREVLLQTGKVKAIHKMNSNFFGEGLTLLGERLFQVTWLQRIGFIYDRYNLSKWEAFTHQMQDGWGLTTNGSTIFGSDGTSALYQLDPKNLKVRRKATVRYEDHEIHYLNELEYINGEVWANVWQTDCIARISQEDGKVLSWILLHKLREGLISSGYANIDVLNGIAWDEENKRLFVTGKLWPKLYEIKLQPVVGPLNDTIQYLCQLN